jgi:hypothetical protein
MDTTPTEVQASAEPTAIETTSAEPVVKETHFGDDWHKKLVANDDGTVDEKELKKLERFKTPKDLAKAFIEAQNKISDGVRKPLSKDASPEAIAEWRKDMGIPDAPDGYDLNIDGVQIGEFDKPLVDTFLARMHASNASPEIVKEAIAAYYDTQRQVADTMAQMDVDGAAQKESALRELYGNEYAPNMTRISNLLATAPDGVRDALMAARSPDGSLISNKPEFNTWLTDIAMKSGQPNTTATPNSTAIARDSAEARMVEIRGKMGTQEYYANDGAMQKEYMKLLESMGR